MSFPGPATKVCAKCAQRLPLDAFPMRCGKGRKPRPHSYCRECRRKEALDRFRSEGPAEKLRKRKWREARRTRNLLLRRRWRKANKLKVVEQHRRWRLKHKAGRLAWRRRYADTNRAQLRARARKYEAARLLSDPAYRVARRLRNRLHLILGGRSRYASAVRDLGCSPKELVEHLETRFLAGMSWDNYGCGAGCWNIDHIVPFLAGKLVDLGLPEVQRKLCHYTNLRPLWQVDNYARNDPSVLRAELLSLGYLRPDGSVSFPCDNEQAETRRLA